MADAAKALVQPPAYDANGQPIAPEALPEALAKGTAFFPKGSRVFARNDRGDLISVDAADVSHPNIQVLTPDEVQGIQEHKEYGKGVGNMAKAFGAGAARTLTFGGSDVAARALGGSETAHSLKALREQNPISSGAGEIAGAVAPLLLTDGASAGVEGAEAAGAGTEAAQGAGALRTAANVATSVPRGIAGAGSLVERGVERGLEGLGYEGKTLLGRTAARGASLAAGGATEGGLYGAQGAISEQALNDHDQTAENLLAGMGHGALLGAALGGSIGAGSEILSYGARRALGESADSLGGIIHSRGGKIVGNSSKGTFEHGLDSAGEDEGGEGEGGGEGALTRLARNQGLRSIGTQAQIQKLGGRAVGNEAEQRIAATADDLLGYKIQTGELKGTPLLEKGDNAADIAEKITYAKKEVGAARQGVMEQLDEAMSAPVAANDAGQFGVQGMAASAAPSVDEFQNQVREAEWYKALKNSKPLRSQFRAVESELNTLNPADENSFLKLNQWGRDLREKFQPPTPTGGGLPPQPPKSAKYLEKLERSMADYIDTKAQTALQALGEDPNKYTELTRQYSSLSKLGAMAQKTVNRGNRMLSPSDQGLGAAGFLASVVSGHPLAGILGGGATAIANNLLRTRGNSVIAGLARDASDMEGTLERTAHHLADKTVEGTGILSSIEGGKESGGSDSSAPAQSLPRVASIGALTKQYTETVNRVRELAEPQNAASHISPLLAGVTNQYPDIGATASQKLLGMYLDLKKGIPMPSMTPDQSLTPQAVQARVPPMFMQDYMSRVRGTTAPRAVLNDLGKGILDRTALDAVKANYPKTFDALRKRVTELVASRHDELPYQKTVFLSMAFGFIGDQSLQPQKLESIQQTFATMQQTGETQQSDARATPRKAVDSQKFSESLQLPHMQRED